ncbi:MAG: c-type cytochrome [Candidatus Obscuribacterales bacterium]|nr:c-type cytochrome [Candidatus Obscuribacterales bacterium]
MIDSIKKNVPVVLGSGLFFMLIFIPSLNARDSKPATVKSNGERLYMANCEACHMLGSNVIQPEKELVKSDKLATRKIFKEFLSEKHGVMPPFQDIANDTAGLKDLYTFVRKLKMTSWEYEPKNEPPAGEVEPRVPTPPHNAK